MSDDEKNPGNIGERVTALETNMRWVKKILEKIDKRTYYILASVLVSIFLAILAIAAKLI